MNILYPLNEIAFVVGNIIQFNTSIISAYFSNYKFTFLFIPKKVFLCIRFWNSKVEIDKKKTKNSSSHIITELNIKIFLCITKRYSCVSAIVISIQSQENLHVLVCEYSYIKWPNTKIKKKFVLTYGWCCV